MSHAYNSMEAYNRSLIDAQKNADSSGITLAHGYCSFAGWTTVNANNRLAIAELGDVSTVIPKPKDKRKR